MFLVLGLRAGELFALRRNDRIEPSQLYIDESVSEELRGDERVVTPKTLSSKAYVWLPDSIRVELDGWLGQWKISVRRRSSSRRERDAAEHEQLSPEDDQTGGAQSAVDGSAAKPKVAGVVPRGGQPSGLPQDLRHAHAKARDG